MKSKDFDELMVRLYPYIQRYMCSQGWNRTTAAIEVAKHCFANDIRGEDVDMFRQAFKRLHDCGFLDFDDVFRF